MRITYHWSLMSEEGRKLGLGSMAMALLAGVPLAVARVGGWNVAPGMPPSWALAGFGVCVAVAAMLWIAFSRRQDEMFARIQNRAWGQAGIITAVIAAGWGVLTWAHIATPMPALAPLWLLLGTKLLFWSAAVRRWL